MNDAEPEYEPTLNSRILRPRAALEVLLILALFIIYAAEPTPAVNEAHYLSKAKHYWNPSWAAGDLLLESADAHLVYYWSFGWVTRLISLPAAAWIGRLLTWSLLAWSWRRLSFSVVPRNWLAILTGGLFVALLRWTHMAGEWVVGGVEAKGFAYVLLFLALESLVKNRWRVVWPLLGAASSFHVLTGGWGVIAAGVAWLLQGQSRPRLVSMLPWLALGFVLSLPGLIPAIALTRGASPEIVREANQIYVFQRLSHHLVFTWLPSIAIARHASLIVVWCGMVAYVRRDEHQRRLAGFVAGAVSIAIMGAVLDVALQNHDDLAASLLRFYWFRLSDATVPLGASLAFAGCIVKLRGSFHRTSCGLIALATAFVAATLLHSAIRHASDWRGGADAQSLPSYPHRPEWTRRVYDDWRTTCDWIEENTPADAVFLTPRSQQTFTWYAGRAEVVNWKDVPQDAAALVEWSHRMNRVYPQSSQLGEWATLTDERLREIGREFGATYLVLDRTRHRPRRGLERVYPVEYDRDKIYEVYRL